MQTTRRDGLRSRLPGHDCRILRQAPHAGVSCIASKRNELVVSYDSKIYKCTGRDFTCSLQEGELSIDGTIIWDEEKLDKRLSIKTYDNPMCRKCKLLPMCWGPCCQKQIENNNNNLDKYCQLNHMEMSLDDYILFRFNNEIIHQRNTSS